MNIADGAMVSVFSDAMAFLLIIGLMILPDGKMMRSETEGRLYRLLCLNTLLIAFFGGICYVMRGRTEVTVSVLVLVSKTIVELCLMNLVFQWVMYVDFKLYKSRDQLRRRYLGLYIPAAVFCLLLLINLFTGILFTIQPGMSYTSTILYDVMMALEYLYILISMLLILQYDRAHPGRRSFSIVPALIPMILGSVVSVFTSYSATALGIAVGLVLSYFSMINGWRFEDKESGYFNRALLRGILESDSPIVDTIRGAIFFVTDGDAGKLGELLKLEMPPEVVIVHDSEKRYVLLTRSGNPGDLRFLAGLVTDAAEEDQAPGLSTRCAVRKKGEGAKDFIRRIVQEEKETEKN